MGITDELRMGGIYRFPSNRRVSTEEELTAIADCIDAEHEKQMAERRRNCVFYDAERNYCKVHDEGDMADFGWVRLPVDADGEAIYVGDVMEEQLPFGGYADPAPVDTMELSRGAGGYGWMVRLDSEGGAFINPKLLRHHHAPTVEDVLREFAHVGIRIAAKHGIKAGEIDFYADEDAIAEYAAKLTLRGEE